MGITGRKAVWKISILVEVFILFERFFLAVFYVLQLSIKKNKIFEWYFLNPVNLS